MARSYLVMTMTRGNSKLRQSSRCACGRSRSAAAAPSNACGVGEAPALPEESSVSSAGTHNRVQCGCLASQCQSFPESWMESEEEALLNIQEVCIGATPRHLPSNYATDRGSPKSRMASGIREYYQSSTLRSIYRGMNINP